METKDEESLAEKVKEKPVTITLRISNRQHGALRRVAFETHTSINKLMMEGLAEVLRRHGR
jgi:predicted HicB family RNase H-like nuclease